MKIGNNPEQWIKESLGGMGGPFDIKVDEVIISGHWRSDLSIATSFRSEKGRVFLAGDAGKSSNKNMNTMRGNTDSFQKKKK